MPSTDIGQCVNFWQIYFWLKIQCVALSPRQLSSISKNSKRSIVRLFGSSGSYILLFIVFGGSWDFLFVCCLKHFFQYVNPLMPDKSNMVHTSRQDRTAILDEIFAYFPLIFRRWYPIRHFSAHMFMDSAYFPLIFRSFSAYFPPEIPPIFRRSCLAGICFIFSFRGAIVTMS